MEKKTANIINFFELSEEWQKEAISNFNTKEEAEEASYLEPEEQHNPQEHILYDLSECFPIMQEKECKDGNEYNAVIGISNNSAMLLNISDCGTQADYWFV